MWLSLRFIVKSYSVSTVWHCSFVSTVCLWWRRVGQRFSKVQLSYCIVGYICICCSFCSVKAEVYVVTLREYSCLDFFFPPPQLTSVFFVLDFRFLLFSNCHFRIYVYSHVCLVNCQYVWICFTGNGHNCVFCPLFAACSGLYLCCVWR